MWFVGYTYYRKLLCRIFIVYTVFIIGVSTFAFRADHRFISSVIYSYADCTHLRIPKTIVQLLVCKAYALAGAGYCPHCF
ncbi:hypothetical protein CS542_04520 [Pedobacter sp. IW39]|nr:hypothetical protein CS542_04520 [Pedobacter sp. IW39]